MRRRVFSFTAPLLVALALPALAQANTGTVLTVSPSQHQVQLVSQSDVVQGYSYRGHLLDRVERGTRLAFATAHSRIIHARAFGKASKFSFLGKVVGSNKGALVLALADSQRLSLATKHTTAHRGGRVERRGHCDSSSTPTVTININVQSGETVLVTETTDSSGDVTVTISSPPAGESEFGPALTATGVVDNVGNSYFNITTGDQSNLNFHVAAATLAGLKLSPCDSVVVTYHTDDQLLIADNVVDNGPSRSASCSSGDGSGSSSGAIEADWIGTITAVSPTSVTVDGSGNAGTQTFSVEQPSITSGFLVGDDVNVTYAQDGTTFVAKAIAYYNSLTSGVVTALAQAGSGFDTITLTDDQSSQSETFYVSAAVLQGQGALVGDDVSISYYQAARGLTVDHLHDNGPAS
jgi:hypothetical protein